MCQELLWQMSTGCNVTSEESKINLNERCPFIEFGGMTKECKCQGCAKLPKRPPFFHDPISYAETLNNPRILKSHLPLSMLPKDVLEVSKVVVIARNVKDVCVSYYYHEKLLNVHGLDSSVSFEDYALRFMDGNPEAYGNYWIHLGPLEILCLIIGEHLREHLVVP